MASSASSPPYARAREALTTASDQFDLQLRTLSRLQSAARSALARITWRIASQKRASRISALLRALPRIMVGHVTRTRKSSGWQFRADDVLVATVVVAPAYAVEELLAPLPVHVHRPALVDLVALAELEQAGMALLLLTDQH